MWCLDCARLTPPLNVPCLPPLQDLPQIQVFSLVDVLLHAHVLHHLALPWLSECFWNTMIPWTINASENIDDCSELTKNGLNQIKVHDDVLESETGDDAVKLKIEIENNLKKLKVNLQKCLAIIVTTKSNLWVGVALLHTVVVIPRWRSQDSSENKYKYWDWKYHNSFRSWVPQKQAETELSQAQCSFFRGVTKNPKKLRNVQILVSPTQRSTQSPLA